VRRTSRPSVLGIDLGTSSVKAVSLASGNTLLAEASAGYDVTAPYTGQAESEPEAWWAATVVAVRECVKRADSVPAAIGLSGQMHGVVLADDSGGAIRPALLWADSRATDEVAAYHRLPAKVTRRLMNPLAPGMAGPMLLWLAAHEPGHYAEARWALQPKDWLRLRLTALAASDPSDASATLLYDIPADRWHVELIDALGLDHRLLPDLASSAGLAGPLHRAAADALGLASGTPVVTGAADTAAGIVGTGLMPGQVQMSVGTGIQIVTLRNEAVAADRPVTHLYRTAENEGWYAMAAILNGGIALNWVRGLFGAEWSELYESAALPGRLDDPIFLPHLVGERTPHLDPDLRGAWVGLGLDHDRTTLLRSALEGVAFAVAEAVDALIEPDATPDAARSAVSVSGRGSASAAWQQLLADVLGRVIVPSASTDSSGRGAALLAGRLIALPANPDRRSGTAPETEKVRPRPHETDLLGSRRQRFAASMAALRQHQRPGSEGTIPTWER
jgi:xylulokinase